ncbi:MAG: hypothetical protein K0R29_2537 [Pseudobdellovibrio sp.]|nr:hypothetical protein [Pseudobdellovibrio sp.]
MIPSDPLTVLEPFDNDKVLNVQNLEKKVKNVEPFAKINTAIESGRTFMVIPSGAPKEFIEAIKSRKNTVSKLNSNRRFWNDLKSYELKSNLDKENKFEKFSFNIPEWQLKPSWKIAVYKEYVIQTKNTIFSVKVIPKAFGGLERLLSTAAAASDSDSLILSTGNLLYDDNLRYALLADFFKAHKNAFVVANSAEIENYGNVATDLRITAVQKERVVSSNLCETKEDKCEKVFNPFVSIESAGLKVAVVGLTNPELQNEVDKLAATMPPLRKLKIQKPVSEELTALVYKLRESHDLVVLATNMQPSYVSENLHDVSGVDFILYRDNRKFVWDEVSELRLSNYAQRFPLHTIKTIDVSTTYGHQLRIEKKNKDLIVKGRRFVLDQSKDSGTSFNDTYSRGFVDDFYQIKDILPDHKSIFADKLVPDQTEFAKMCAQLMKTRFNGEIGIFNVQPQNSTTVGPQGERDIRTWVRPDDFIEVAYLKGDEIKKLHRLNETLKEGDKLVFFGISSDFKLNGLSINDSEYYRVVLPKTVSQSQQYSIEADHRFDRFVEMTNGTYEDSIDGKVVNLADFIVHDLREWWKRYQQAKSEPSPARLEAISKEYEKLYNGEALQAPTGYWTHTLDNLSLEYSQLSTTDAAAFSSVTDSRLKTVDQRYIAASLNYKASYNKAPFVNELGLSARYSKQELLPSGQPSIITILDDQLRTYANASLPVYSLDNHKWLAKEMGPYLEVSYETEFEAEPGLSLQKNLTGFAGWKFFSGELVKSASLFALINKYLTESNPRTVTGAGYRFEIGKRVLNNVAEYKLFSEYRYFFDDDDPVADIRSRFVLDQSFNLKITNKISFGPYFRYFSLTRKSVNESIYQNMIGVNLTYSDFWKPRYRTP